MDYLTKKTEYTDTLGILLLFISIHIAISRSFLHIDNTFLSWVLNYSVIALCIKYAIESNILLSKTYIYCTLFLGWALLGAVRGILNIDNYWFAKQMLYGVTCVSLPSLAFIFVDPLKATKILRTYNHWIFYFVIFVSSWLTEKDSFHLCYGPVYFLYGIFLLWQPNKWKYWTLGIILLMLFVDIGARSQIIKAAITILMLCAIAINKYIPHFLIKNCFWAFYIGAITLLVLGISGEFNIFDFGNKATDNEIIYREGQFIVPETISGDENTLADTRTFIYIEVISSAVIHDYVLFGRTLARGNDSISYGKASMTGESERYDNELCHTNIFTWLGIVGVFLYFIIYITASFLSAYYSKNIYITYLGILVAFHWFFGWMEDMNKMDGMNVGLWMIIGMCLSPKFRQMSNIEFKLWFKSIFSDNGYSVFRKFKVLELFYKLSHVKKMQKDNRYESNILQSVIKHDE